AVACRVAIVQADDCAQIPAPVVVRLGLEASGESAGHAWLMLLQCNQSAELGSLLARHLAAKLEHLFQVDGDAVPITKLAAKQSAAEPCAGVVRVSGKYPVRIGEELAVQCLQNGAITAGSQGRCQRLRNVRNGFGVGAILLSKDCERLAVA